MKGAILAEHMPTNRYSLAILNFVTLTATEISGLEDELETVELPDRTRVTGGNRGASEFTVMIPMHHTVEVAAMELWFVQCQDPVAPDYKKVGTLTHKSISDQAARAYTLSGMFITKRKLPDLEMAGEGEMGTIEFTISVDDILPI